MKHCELNIVFTIIVTTLLCIPNFALETIDGSNYMDMVLMFRGIDITAGAPYHYRPLVPFLASLIPASSAIALGFVNLICSVLTSILVYLIATEFATEKESMFVTMVYMLSWNIFRFGAITHIDAAEAFFFALFVFSWFKFDNPTLLSVITVTGILVKETFIFLLIPILYKHCKFVFPTALSQGIIELFIRNFADRGTVFEGTIGYTWWLAPSRNVTFITVYSLIACILPLGILAAIAIIRMDVSWNEYVLLIPGCIIMLLGLLLGAFDGRFLWPLQIGMIPISAMGIRNTFMR